MKARDQAGGNDSPKEQPNHYQLLHIDPDAPYEIVAEAYWFHASRLRAEKVARRAERELTAINSAYRALANVEDRRAYDSSLPQLVELRRQRDERARLREQQERWTTRLRRKRQAREIDYYELLGVDPVAEAPLVARAYSILKTVRAKKGPGKLSKEYLKDLAEARAVLLDRELRAAYDEMRSRPAPEPEAEAKQSVKRAPVQRTVEKPKAAKAQKVKTSSPKRAERPEKPAGPSWRELSGRAGSTTGRASLVAATVAGRSFASAGRLGARTMLVLGKRGGESLRAAGRDARHFAEQMWSPERTKAATRLPDDRLLRYAGPLSARAERIERGGLHGRLAVRDAEGHEQTVELGDAPVTIGSDRECEIRLVGDGVAPAQAQIWFTGERFVIRSLDPLHETTVCGQRVNWAGLEDGDEIEIGAYRLRFETVGPLDHPPDFLTLEQETTARAEEIPERHE